MRSSTKHLERRDLPAVASPIRQQILHLLAEGDELSGRMLAERLLNPPSNLYYHLGILRDAGLIEVTRRKQRRGAIEKYYRAVAEVFTLAPGELGRASTPEGADTPSLCCASSWCDDTRSLGGGPGSSAIGTCTRIWAS